MLCSLSAPKSTSNWLDRLRVSKGFPVSPELDLDHFLSSSNPSPNPNPNPSPSPNKQDPPTKVPIKPRDGRLFNLVTNALSDLFVMGNPQRPSPRKKTSRKQSNPRILVPSSASGSVEGGADKAEVSPSSADHSMAEAGRDRAVKVKKKRSSIVSADADLAGFSRTEVTVIDTSFPGWKSEKVVFRKGMVWKVREKKLRRSFGGRKKKMKLGLVEKLATENKDKSAAAAPEKEEDAEKEEDFKATNEQSLVPRRRKKFLSSTHPSATKHPTFCSLKGISTSKNNEAYDPRSALKEN